MAHDSIVRDDVVRQPATMRGAATPMRPDATKRQIEAAGGDQVPGEHRPQRLACALSGGVCAEPGATTRRRRNVGEAR